MMMPLLPSFVGERIINAAAAACIREQQQKRTAWDIVKRDDNQQQHKPWRRRWKKFTYHSDGCPCWCRCCCPVLRLGTGGTTKTTRWDDATINHKAAATTLKSTYQVLWHGLAAQQERQGEMTRQSTTSSGNNNNNNINVPSDFVPKQPASCSLARTGGTTRTTRSDDMTINLEEQRQQQQQQQQHPTNIPWIKKNKTDDSDLKRQHMALLPCWRLHKLW